MIVQGEQFDSTNSLTICAFTTNPTDSPTFRLLIQPNEMNSLRQPSRLMVDKVVTISKSKFGRRLGALDAEDMVRLNGAILVFLGLAGPAASSSTAN